MKQRIAVVIGIVAAVSALLGVWLAQDPRPLDVDRWVALAFVLGVSAFGCIALLSAPSRDMPGE